MFLLGTDHIIFVLLQLWELSNAQHHCIIGVDLWSFIEMMKRALCGIVVQQHEHLNILSMVLKATDAQHPHSSC